MSTSGDAQWQVVLTITDPSETIIRIMAERLRDEWLAPGDSVTVEIRNISRPDGEPGAGDPGGTHGEQEERDEQARQHEGNLT
jgi:hypothetical protein